MATSKMLDFIRTSIKQTLTKSVWQSAQLNSSKKKERAILPIYENMLLGDVVMSYNTVLNEASLFRKSFDARVSHLFVHGLLHILGYDHVSEQDRHEMETLETKILSTCDIENPYTSSL